MAKWAFCVLCGFAVGCGPSVSAPAGDGSGSSGDTSSTGIPTETTPSSGTTAGDENTSDVVASTGGSDSSGELDTDAEPDELCLRGTPQPMLDPEHALLRILDTDGNGRDEIWLSEVQWDPVLEIQSSILRPFELDERGAFVALSEIELPGRIDALVDINGDGHLDVVLKQWDDPASWWQAGLPTFEVDATVQPLQARGAGNAGSWVDVTGDNTADFLEQSEEFGFRVFVGDGAGTFTPAGTSALEGHWPHKAFALPALGQLVLLFQVPTFGFLTDISVVRTVAVDANGELQVLAQSGGLDNVPLFVEDLDGDAIADVIGVDGLDNTLRYLGSAQGPYEEVVIVENVRNAVVGGFVQEDVEILWWDGRAQPQLLRRDGATWPDEAPVAASSQWDARGQMRVLEADGEPGAEVLQASETYSLWSVEEC